MRTRRRDGLWIALLISAAFHAGVLVYVATRPPPASAPVQPAGEPPIAIQIVEVPAVKVPPSAPGAAPRPAPGAEQERRRRSRAEASRSAGSSERTPAGSPEAEDAPRTSGLVESPSLMPSERALDEIVGDGSGGPVVLGGPGSEAVPESDRYGWAGPGSSIHAPRVPKDLVGEAVAEALGKRRAELGIVDPYFRDVGKALEKSWRADQVGPPPQTLAETVRDFGKAVQRFKDVWMERAEGFGKTGNPLPAGVADAIGFDHGVLASGSDQMKSMMGYQTLMSAGFTSVRRAVLRVVQDEEGKIILVELVEPSQDRDMDRQALTDVRAAAELLPPPPASLLGTKTQLSSFWTFEIKLRVIPPSTGIAFEFDEKGIQPLVPFGHQVKKSVRLLYFN